MHCVHLKSFLSSVLTFEITHNATPSAARRWISWSRHTIRRRVHYLHISRPVICRSGHTVAGSLRFWSQHKKQRRLTQLLFTYFSACIRCSAGLDCKRNDDAWLDHNLRLSRSVIRRLAGLECDRERRHDAVGHSRYFRLAWSVLNHRVCFIIKFSTNFSVKLFFKWIFLIPWLSDFFVFRPWPGSTRVDEGF